MYSPFKFGKATATRENTLTMAMQFQEITAQPSQITFSVFSMSCADNATVSEKLQKKLETLNFSIQILTALRVAML